VGTVEIGDDVEIRANTTIDRAALGVTRVGPGTKLDNLIQVAHNVIIGAHSAVAASTAIAGSTRIGSRCLIGCGVVILGQLAIGDDIVIAGASVVTRSLDSPGMYSSVFPVEDVRFWRRLVGRVRRLDLLAGRVRKLEAANSSAATGQDNDS
jgi:UDP-3-O-[3-hydroxymyristoyl] glucosamine N-acyltransferase